MQEHPNDNDDFRPDLAQFAPPSIAPAAPAGRAIESWRLAFNGDGGVYFGVWLVNILLTIVTIGLYTPWARRRTIRYFYGHTLVADSPLEFTAGIRSMVFGFLLFAGIYIALNLAERTGQHLVYGLILGGGVLLAPFLWGSAMRFRLRHTRWRGLRLRFGARWGEVYRASWPVFVAALLWLGAGLAIHHLLEPARQKAAAEQQAFAKMMQEWESEGTAPEDRRFKPSLPRPTWPMAGIALGATLLSLLCFVRLEFNYRRLLVQRSSIGAQAAHWRVRFAAFLRIWLAALGFFFALLLALALVAVVLTGGGALVAGGRAALSGARGGTAVVLMVMAGFFVAFIALFLSAAPAMAYREARMFQLMWNHIGIGDVARFKTDLRTAGFVWLRIRNMLLNFVTGGFYRPFARVAEYKMKTESLTLHLKGGLAQLVGQLDQEQKDSFGDAVADALGFDVIG